MPSRRRTELGDDGAMWWCVRAGGVEDGFLEAEAKPWQLLTSLDLPELERPCWINEDTGEFFFVEG